MSNPSDKMEEISMNLQKDKNLEEIRQLVD